MLRHRFSSLLRAPVRLWCWIPLGLHTALCAQVGVRDSRLEHDYCLVPEYIQHNMGVLIYVRAASCTVARWIADARTSRCTLAHTTLELQEHARACISCAEHGWCYRPVLAVQLFARCVAADRSHDCCQVQQAAQVQPPQNWCSMV